MLDALLLASALADGVPPSAPASVDEIIVTGERIARSLQQTASSVAVETHRTIADKAAPDRIEQLLQQAVNVQLGSGGEGPVIRGQDSTGVVRDLAAFLSGSRPRATIQVDGRAASYYELAFGLTPLWDVERVEIFRSPQTTTQGRNSIGGAIFVETQDPQFEWDGKARLLAGEAMTRQASAAVSVPLVADQLALRLSADLRRSRTASRISSPAAGIDPERDDSDMVRAKLLFRPAALPGSRLLVTYAHGRSQMPQIEGVEEPFRARRNPDAGYGIFAINTDFLTGRFTYAPGNAFDVSATLSYGDADVRRYAPPGLGRARIATQDISVEPIVAWHSQSGARLSAGLHHTRVTLDQAIDISALLLGIGTFSDLQKSTGVFGEALLPLTGTLSLTAGLRYQTDSQVRIGDLRGGLRTLQLDYDRTFRAWLPKVSLAWEAAPGLHLGLQVQRAYNPGGVSLNTQSGRAEFFEAEYLWDYEAFVRTKLDDGRLSISVNGFAYDMIDAQRTQTIEFFAANGQLTTAVQVSNAPRAWTRGLELEADWQPSTRFSLRAVIGLLGTRITRTQVQSDPMLGKEFQRSPHLSASAALAWQPVTPLRLTAQVRHSSGYFSDDIETPDRRVSGSTTFDAKAAWTLGRLTVFGYARNLFDEFHLTYRFSVLSGLATAGDPRELGLGMELSF
ncbi:TonB-dependent receptor [Novosphingobium sp. KN65.2]|uniref:TonB-dependent receptor n=1 Tax=Novosphingobium sp. KN65.2 TaxID=1478134 RepID=UPI0005E838CC|nr:TonB-dependent receptor [Novosphingobium sp. KN65.2]CDO37787.1 putative TonB-dependent siderophore receptor [Novosphingobium sp. KN65.2]